MEPAIFAGLLLATFVGLLVLVLFLVGRQSEKAHRNHTQLALQLGLTPAAVRPKLGFFWPSPTAAGTLRGKAAHLYNFSTGSGKSRTQWSALAVRPRELGGLTFSFSRQGFDTKLALLFGAREITLGDPAFDAMWFVETNQPEFLQAALLPELRQRLTAAVNEAGRPGRSISFKLETDAVVYAEAGDFSDDRVCARIARAADVLCDFADVAEVFAQHSQPGP